MITLQAARSTLDRPRNPSIVDRFGTRELDCGTVVGHRAHLRDATAPCERCLDAAAVNELQETLAKLTWPMERVKLSVLFARRPDLASLPLIGSRLAAGIAESV